MASYIPNVQGYRLPLVINPPDRLCFTIEVPNEQAHLEAFFGALFDLTQWINWERDGTTRAAQSARVWKKIWLALESQICNLPINVATFNESELEMFRKVCDPDGSCHLEFECCPGEWIRLANLDQITNGTQPGDGSPQPQPNGGDQEYCAVLQASGKLLIPTTVSSGDTIDLVSASGAGNDGSEAGWHCQDGNRFFAGQCISGTTETQSGDPLNTQPHMALIIGVGSSYILLNGTITVPSGISNQQAWIQVNDSVLSDNAGNYNVCVKVTNNQAGTWSHDSNFTISPDGWVPVDASGTPRAVWVAGTGWQSNPAYNLGVVEIQHAIARPITIIRAVLNEAATPDPSSAVNIISQPDAFSFVLEAPIGGPGNRTYNFSGSHSTPTLELAAVDTSLASTLTWVSVHVEGTGINPFA